MRLRSFLVCYDIRNPKRLNKVYTTMRGYGEHIQYSVFLCELTEVLHNQLQEELTQLIDWKEDQILFIPLQHRIHFETLGCPLPSRDRDLILVMDGLEEDSSDNN